MVHGGSPEFLHQPAIPFSLSWFLPLISPFHPLTFLILPSGRELAAILPLPCNAWSKRAKSCQRVFTRIGGAKKRPMLDRKRFSMSCSLGSAWLCGSSALLQARMYVSLASLTQHDTSPHTVVFDILHKASLSFSCEPTFRNASNVSPFRKTWTLTGLLQSNGPDLGFFPAFCATKKAT